MKIKKEYKIIFLTYFSNSVPCITLLSPQGLRKAACGGGTRPPWKTSSFKGSLMTPSTTSVFSS